MILFIMTVTINIIISHVYVDLYYFKQKTAYELRMSDWSSDVCSSDLLGLTLFDRRTQGWFTEGPKTKLILGANFESGPFMINVKETRYDKFRSLDNNAANDQRFGAKWITDIEVSYGFNEKLRVAAGAYNILDVYPDLHTLNRKRVV